MLDLHKTIFRLEYFYHPMYDPFAKKGVDLKNTLLIITGDKGFAGDLHHRLITTYFLNKNLYDSLIIIGEKGKSLLSGEKDKTILALSGILESLDDNFSVAVDQLIDSISKSYLGKLDILYPKFNSFSQLTPTIVNFLPLNFDQVTWDQENILRLESGLPIFEPNKRKLGNFLIDQYIKAYLGTILIDSTLSEVVSRIVTLENGKNESHRLSKKYRLLYLGERRKSTTKEQTEEFSAHQVLT